jgi:hypothetical protein
MWRTRQAVSGFSLAALIFSVLILSPRDVSAAHYWFDPHREFPAVSCKPASNLIGIQAGAFVNLGSTVIPMSCPIEFEGDQDSIIDLAAAFVSPGFTPSHCWIVTDLHDATYWIYYPSLSPKSGYDQLEWSTGFLSAGALVALECHLYPGERFNGYYVNTGYRDWRVNL